MTMNMNRLFQKFILNKKRLGIIVWLYMGFLLVIGLWSFRFNPKNNITWLENGGLQFKKYSITYSNPISSSLFEKFIYSKEITIEAVVEPEDAVARKYNYILSFGKEKKQGNFSFVQFEDDLKVYIKTTEMPSGKNINMIQADNIFTDKGRKHILVTLKDQVVKIWINGVIVKEAYVNGSFENWDPGSRIYAGNEESGNRSWEGIIYSISLFDHALSPDILRNDENKPLVSYNFNQSINRNIIENQGVWEKDFYLYAPGYFKVPGISLLDMPERYYLHSLRFFEDVFINVIGFIPFGCLVFVKLLQEGRSLYKAFLLSVVFGFSISLGIELFQIFLPLRASSIVDLFNNTLGTLIGAVIGVFFMRVKSVKF